MYMYMKLNTCVITLIHVTCNIPITCNIIHNLIYCQFAPQYWKISCD